MLIQFYQPVSKSSMSSKWAELCCNSLHLTTSAPARVLLWLTQGNTKPEWEAPPAITVYTNTDTQDRRQANLSLSCSLRSESPLCLSLYLCNILSSPSSLPHESLKMFPGVSFNEANLDGCKLPSQGHFIVTLRWILLSMKRGNIRSLGSHKRPRLSLSLCPAVFSYGLRGYADT